MSIETLKTFYNGFCIDKPVGNNAFSYEQRENKKIYVPSIVEGGLEALAEGEQTSFSEILDGVELNKCGLRNFIYYQKQNKNIFIFDNHNHAFFFWMYGLKEKMFDVGTKLVHVDQHKDMRKPEHSFKCDFSDIDLASAFEYTNFVLHVGNFIEPALELGIFSGVEMIDSEDAFKKTFKSPFVLDIDIDIFSDDMSYIDEGMKASRIKGLISEAQFITVSSSPYFIDQNKAISKIKEMLK